MRCDLEELQKFVESEYFLKDFNRGVEATALWFVEEVGELAEAIIKGEGLEEEFADVLAWLLSLANLLNVDLCEAFKKKYLERTRRGAPP
ncbi:MazG nucleotide pyrophosphohydrolase domain-containing protein [Ignicoccus hospitalis]|uniref:MazG nucleotide pyrophosphohydrolase n=1 Tax=Ignicoccus hospitalis (strain KIN4/I / DSM 18386 / JCM 14125) TaxID=453591 RepID=A8AB92_IGNH4|nr:MazG nucleotide pyrophosphohydrolase [Ignicoccus hospitalis KIN4/I]